MFYQSVILIFIPSYTAKIKFVRIESIYFILNDNF